jgi:cytochrome c-type protein NapC
MGNSTGKVRRWRLTVGAIVFVAGFAAFFSFDAALHATNSTEFCISCHSMQGNYQEYKKSVHYRSASGVRAECADCHVPKAFGPRLVAKLAAAKDVWHEWQGTIDTPEKFEARRWLMATRVWGGMRANDSRECRSCHDLESMDLRAQDSSAAKKHAKARERGKTCIDCHAGLVHQQPEAPVGIVAESDES